MIAPRWRVAVIFFTVLIDLIGFGIILPILPYYSQTFGAEGLGFGILVMSFSAMQFLATAVLGRLSDRVGRRPILLVTTLVNAAGYIMFAFAGSYGALLAARIISGFAGGNISVAQAYMADISSPAERSRRMGFLGAAFGIGFSVGPFVGAAAAVKWGHAGPGYVAAFLSLANFVSAYFILPESLDAQHRTRRALLDFGHFADVLARPRLRPLMTVWGLAPFAFAGYTVVLPFFAAARFGWGTPELGIFFGEVGLTAAIVQGVLFGKLARRFGDRRLVIAGTVGMALGIGGVPFVPSGFALYAWTLVLAFSNSLFAPAATGLVSVYAGPTEQGTVLGTAQALAALGRVAGPLALGWGYDRFGGQPVFLIAAGIMLFSSLAGLGLEAVNPDAPMAPRGAGSGERG